MGETERMTTGGAHDPAAGEGGGAPVFVPDAAAFAEIIENAPVGLYVAQDGQLVYGNRWLRELCGVPLAGLPRSPLSVVVEEDRALVLEQMTKRMRGEDALPHYTVRIPRPDGTVAVTELYAQVVTWRGRPAIQGSVVDIGDKEEFARRLREYNAHLEEANRYREIFGEIISKDLLNPVWVVQGFLRMVREEADPERRAALLAKAEATLERTRDVLQDARAYLRLLEPRRLTAEPQDLGELVAGAVEALRRLWERGGRQVRVSLPGPISVVGSPSLREVFVNLLANAIEHGPPGEPIEVIAREGDPIRVEVRDRGPGVPARDRERIFRRFERTGHGRGLGLGLAVVRSIVQSHGGRVWVEDNPGGGSVFAVELPTAQRRGAVGD